MALAYGHCNVRFLRRRYPGKQQLLFHLRCGRPPQSEHGGNGGGAHSAADLGGFLKPSSHLPAVVLEIAG